MQAGSLYINFDQSDFFYHLLPPLPPLPPAHFGSFQLSPDGRQLLYVAEREKPKSCSFFKKEKEEKEGKKEGEEKKSEDDSSKSKPIPVRKKIP